MKSRYMIYRCKYFTLSLDFRQLLIGLYWTNVPKVYGYEPFIRSHTRVWLCIVPCLVFYTVIFWETEREARRYYYNR